MQTGNNYPNVIPISCWKCSEIMLIDVSLGFETDSKVLCDGCIERNRVRLRDKKIGKILSRRWYERIFG